MLTDTQQTTLAAHIRANTDIDVVAALAIRNDTELARLYNLDSSYVVWRELVTPDEYYAGIVWTEVDNLTVGKARIWEWITRSMTVGYDATQPNIRAGLGEAFKNLDTATNLIPLSKELATIAQEIYATGTGSVGDPGVRDVVGDITINDVGRALNDNP